MVDLAELKPKCFSKDQTKVQYDASNCYVIPLRFFYSHLRIGNLEFKIPPEEMSRNYRVTTRFCGEFLYDIVENGELNVDSFPEFALFNAKEQKWYGIKVPDGITAVYFSVSGRPMKWVFNQYFYEWKDWKNANISAVDEFRYNTQFCNLCSYSVPFRLVSRAPINGEANAILFNANNG